MAVSTAIGNSRPSVRSAVTGGFQSVPVIALDFANGQSVAVGAASGASAIFDANNDRIVELSANTNCWYSVAPAPTATNVAGSAFLAAGALRYVYVPANCKIAVIQDSAGGAIGMVPAINGS